MDTVKRAPRIAVVVSHPIQHFTPFYRGLTEGGTDLHVLFMSGDGIRAYFDTGFGREVQWRGTSVEGFRHDVVFDHQAGTTWKRPWASGAAIWRQLDRVKPDCVLVHGYAHSFSQSALAWCRIRSVPSLLFGDSELLGPRPRRVRLVKRLALPPLFRQVS
nr:hypothetical protein [Micromonospora sp. DSM 115978]